MNEENVNGINKNYTILKWGEIKMIYFHLASKFNMTRNMINESWQNEWYK